MEPRDFAVTFMTIVMIVMTSPDQVDGSPDDQTAAVRPRETPSADLKPERRSALRSEWSLRSPFRVRSNRTACHAIDAERGAEAGTGAARAAPVHLPPPQSQGSPFPQP